jgi:rRNA maturation protein Rpf1
MPIDTLEKIFRNLYFVSSNMFKIIGIKKRNEMKNNKNKFDRLSSTNIIVNIIVIKTVG